VHGNNNNNNNNNSAPAQLAVEVADDVTSSRDVTASTPTSTRCKYHVTSLISATVLDIELETPRESCTLTSTLTDIAFCSERLLFILSKITPNCKGKGKGPVYI